MRFRRTLALAACGVFLMGARLDCPKKDNAQGQQPAPVPNEPVPAQDPYPTRDDRQLRVTFKMSTKPMNTQTIEWKLGSKGNKFQWHDDSWDRIEVGSPGDVATLTVQADEQGRFVICQIWVNGQMPTLNMLSKGDNPYMHRNDAGDCKVRVTLK